MSKKLSKEEEQRIRIMLLNNQMILDRRSSIKTSVSGDLPTGSTPAPPAAMTDAEFNALFDKLNLQSDNVNNFSLSTTSIDQWKDLSPSANHASAVTTARPTYSTSNVAFDGTTDFLTLNSEISLAGDFSLYVVYRKTSLAANRILFGSSIAPDVFYQVNTNQTIQASHIADSGGSSTWIHGAMTNMNVFSIRRSSGVYQLKVNDRTLINNSNLLVGVPTQRIGLIGKRIAGAFFDGAMKCFCVASSAIDDTTDSRVRDYIYTKYTLPTQQSLLGFGDSITAQDMWLTKLGTALTLPVVNNGISGSLLTGVASSSGIQRYLTQVVTRPYTDKIVITYGTNDQQSGVDKTTYEANYRTIISGWISAGYDPRNICLQSVPYQTGGANASDLDLYKNIVQSIATTYNTRFCDILNIFRAQPSPDTLMNNALHMNSAGGDLTRDSLVVAFTGP